MCLHGVAMSDAITGSTAAATLTYLRRVYVHDTLPADEVTLRRRFEDLDFYYPGAADSSSLPCLPFTIGGAYFKAPGFLPGSLAAGASPHRYAHPITLVGAHTHANSCAFTSGVTGRHGPQPAWTPHRVLTRYIFYPAGFCENATQQSGLDSPCTKFNLRGSRHVTRLRALRAGDRVEVTQYGGWLNPGRESGKGLWANIWRGTGVYLRVGAPFVSLCKVCCLVDMLELLEQRNASAVIEVSRLLGTSSQPEERSLQQRITSAAVAAVPLAHMHMRSR